MPPATSNELLLNTDSKTVKENSSSIDNKMCLTTLNGTNPTPPSSNNSDSNATIPVNTNTNNNSNLPCSSNINIKSEINDNNNSIEQFDSVIKQRKCETTKNAETSSGIAVKSLDNKNNDINTSVVKDFLESEKLESTNDDENLNKEFHPQIRWPDLIVQVSLHLGLVYGFYLLFYAKYLTVLWFFTVLVGSGFGITAGAHRLWSHRAYKAKLPLRLILIFLFTIAGQRDAYTWALDHRIHHKFSETDADPHNAKRGFFFAHVGWLFLTPHPRVVEKRKVIDMTDLEQDQILQWQKRLYIPLFALLVIGMPTLVPWYFWQEDLWIAFWTCFCCRFTAVLNIAFFVNSVAHMYGNKPYDKKISPTESLPVAIAALGEGWHNYHHVFPWDYKTGEFGDYKFNISTAFIDFFSKIGWAYDRKSVSKDMIARRAAKCGDGSHFLCDEMVHQDPVWGYGDKDIPKEDVVELEKMHD
ncbi:acyl-CoA Delta-9 desaturase-like [Condylostylus longicornis]|uniref:acyl-CoA Delta-9 desaturase-like n=1 Tax=Condylostylus longicornis TaxID=2530218 RepID=UPI00244DACC1|nr:acyl-CoA Delta-9 desaturase-like [Condylostylus longicornis]XP_055374925.1 acyl-CoA Delta-9 desaturase-like [Condylostylus longicornis]XP_055374933.1 acyl-CoA Delta-9 desaturase-like [Condylostylus longicornis]